MKRFLQFNYQYLSNFYSIFSQISICYSSKYTLSEQLPLFFNLMTASWCKIRLKATIANYARLRVMSMGIEFLSKPEITLRYTLSCISLIFQAFALKFEYVIVETLLFL